MSEENWNTAEIGGGTRMGKVTRIIERTSSTQKQLDMMEIKAEKEYARLEQIRISKLDNQGFLDQIQLMLDTHRVQVAEDIVEIMAYQEDKVIRIAMESFMTGHRTNINGLPEPGESLRVMALSVARNLLEHEK